MPLDLTLLALRLQDVRVLAHASLREEKKSAADEYQYEIAEIAEELLRAVEAELAAAREGR